jgi:soluble lytic murein transglycosylase-like protein
LDLSEGQPIESNVMGRRTASILVLAAVFLAPAFVSADVYSYIDGNGVLHLTNVPPRGPSAGRYKVIMRTPPQRAARDGVVPVMASDSDPQRFSRFDRHIAEASRLYAIPEALIRAVVQVESNYDPRVVSHCGAQGLMQLMPITGRRMGVRDPFDPRQNILGGTRYLRYLANLFGGDLVLTIAGYHAGENAVIRYRGVPPYETTQRYVPAVLRHYYRYRSSNRPTTAMSASEPPSASR